MQDLFLPEFYDIIGSFEPLWDVVFILAIVIAVIPIFHRVKWVPLGNTLVLSENKTIIDLSLLVNQNTTAKILKFTANGMFAEIVDDYRISVNLYSNQPKATLILETNFGTFNFAAEYGLSSYIIYLTQRDSRYFQHCRDGCALIEDVLEGYAFALRHSTDDLQYHQYLRGLDQNLKEWQQAVKSGELIRTAAKRRNLPMGLLKYFAKEGKKARLNPPASLEHSL